jgi:hypothetical protein
MKKVFVTADVITTNPGGGGKIIIKEGDKG